MRALEIFLEAGLLGRGVFIPQGFDPDTLIRKLGVDAMRELIAGGELLVDYFLHEQAAASRGPLDERLRAAERVAQLLGKIANPFEFDLIARKASSLIGVGEDLLRQHARKTVRRTSPAPVTVAGPKINPGPSMSTMRAELGLIGIALRWPELRGEIAARMSPADGNLRSLITEICASADSAIALESKVMSEMNAEERAQLSALMIGPLLEDLNKSRALIEDYCLALANDLRRNQLQELRRAAVSAGPEDATAAAQAVIALRREPDHS
jgi:DNA primase